MRTIVPLYTAVLSLILLLLPRWAEAAHCRYQGQSAFGGYTIIRYFCPSHARQAEDAPHRPSPDIGHPRPERLNRPPLISGSLAELARLTAERHGVDPKLVEAVIAVESGWNPRAVSPKGARGLMQLMPQTAARFGVRDSFDPQENVDAGVRYLKWLLDLFSGNPRLALAAYNAGEEAVEKYGGIPPYPETQIYVPKVLRLLR